MGVYNKNQPAWLAVTLVAISICLTACVKDEKKDPVILETGTMMDIDNNSYKTVKIGGRWWMAENLKVTRYRDGSYIQALTDSLSWVTQTTGGYCAYENGTGSIVPPGFLYSYLAVTDVRNVAPDGWHVPTDQDWKDLETALGMTGSEADGLSWRGTDQGNKLRSGDANEWAFSEEIFSNNTSGFTALAGSCRIANGNWGYPGLKYTGFWWSATAFGADQAWYRYLDYKQSNVFRSHANVLYGFSIRCVKD